jgi:hypothetical protein
LPNPIAPAFSDLELNTKNLSCSISFIINNEGLLVDETLTCSTLPWALKRVQNIFTTQQRLSLDGWTKAYREHLENLNQLFSSVAKANAEADRNMTISELIALRQSICQHSDRWQGNRFNFLGYYTVFRRKKINDTSEDILNNPSC